ncbi:MAG: ribonuclease P protein subunit [Promethearchaeota archaeon]|nr:MAG: ribonuclease P protein subunit [Candidatus Lokiarchaeota archaeon]
MSPREAKNIHRHELIGLKVEIRESTDKNLIGLQGIVIDESYHMLTIKPILSSDQKESTKQKVAIPKKNCTFRFTLPTGEQVDVAGKILDLKSENRIKNIIRKRW